MSINVSSWTYGVVFKFYNGKKGREGETERGRERVKEKFKRKKAKQRGRGKEREKKRLCGKGLLFCSFEVHRFF